MKTQRGNEISGIHLYLNTRHNWDGIVVSCTYLPHFPSRVILWQTFPLDGEYTPGILNADRISSSLDNFPRTVNVLRHRLPS